jgi:hypothetical protein
MRQYEAVKEHIVQLAVARHTTLTAQRRAAVRAAKQVEGAARLALLQAGSDAAAEVYARWKAALYALHDAGGRAVAAAKGGVGPVDLLWEVAGEQSTKYFHRLGRQNPAAPVGMTSVKVSSPSGAPQVHSVHDSGGLYAVGQALSAFFDRWQSGRAVCTGSGGCTNATAIAGLHHRGNASQGGCSLPGTPRGWLPHSGLPCGSHGRGARGQGAWQ